MTFLPNSGILRYPISRLFVKFIHQKEVNIHCREVLQVDPLRFCAGAGGSFDYFQVEVFLKEMIEGDELASQIGARDERQL